MENGKNWKKLKDYKCPLFGCGSPLKQFNNPNMTQNSIHKCTNALCDFEIADRRLADITRLKGRKLEPPQFIQELENQSKLNEL